MNVLRLLCLVVVACTVIAPPPRRQAASARARAARSSGVATQCDPDDLPGMVSVATSGMPPSSFMFFFAAPPPNPSVAPRPVRAAALAAREAIATAVAEDGDYDRPGRRPLTTELRESDDDFEHGVAFARRGRGRGRSLRESAYDGFDHESDYEPAGVSWCDSSGTAKSHRRGWNTSCSPREQQRREYHERNTCQPHRLRIAYHELQAS